MECAPVLRQVSSSSINVEGQFPARGGGDPLVGGPGFPFILSGVEAPVGQTGDKILRNKISLFPPQGCPRDSIHGPREHEADTLPMSYRGMFINDGKTMVYKIMV